MDFSRFSWTYFKSLFRQHKSLISNIGLRIISIHGNSSFKIQVVNSKTVFTANLSEIAGDIEILNQLSPSQACFIGIESSILLLDVPEHMTSYFHNTSASIKPVHSEHYRYELKYIARKGKICFFDIKKEIFCFDCPTKIAFRDELINLFHPLQSFYIGVCAGHKFNKSDNIYHINDFREKSKKSLKMLKKNEHIKL